MAMTDRKGWYGAGMTLIEMLTTLTIIVILLALLVPALSMAHKYALTAKQKAQFYSIAAGVEAFKTDFGDYPPSSFNDKPGDVGYCGAQKLAEAMVGLDGLGFHPMSEFRGDGLADFNKDLVYSANEMVYHASSDTVYETADQNRRARKAPYMELEIANAIKLQNIYSKTAIDNTTLNGDTFILADVWGTVKNKATGKSTGMPILYYRANTSNFLHVSDPDPVKRKMNIYDYSDNLPITQFLAPPVGPAGSQHPLADYQLFYQTTANPNFTSPVQQPYRTQSFILWSAGPDALYGTGDDVVNFDK